MNAVIKQEELIKEQTDGYITKIVRFPGGTRTSGKLKGPIQEKLKERGYGWADWTCEDGDGGDLRSADQAWANIKYGLNSDLEVILLHDYNKITISILPDLIEYLQQKGYILLPLFYESNMVNK
jgi:peptidoglycan/xylan/chitin deacetylase (PgdA/CDA1 family)